MHVVFTNGVFDLIHAGHVHYLMAAKQLGDVLIVGLNSDASTRRYKGDKRPLVLQEDRAMVLAGLRAVDRVVVFDEPTAEAIVAALRPDIYVKGGDYAASADATATAKALPEAAIVRAYGGEVAIVPYLPGHSTTALIEKIVAAYG